MSQLKTLLGKRIKELRISKKLTQEQLSEMIGIGAASLSKIEIGMYHPNDDNLEKIAQALGVEPYELYLFNQHKDIKEIKNDILKMINKANENETRLIYKILNSILN